MWVLSYVVCKRLGNHTFYVINADPTHLLAMRSRHLAACACPYDGRALLAKIKAADGHKNGPALLEPADKLVMRAQVSPASQSRRGAKKPARLCSVLVCIIAFHLTQQQSVCRVTYSLMESDLSHNTNTPPTHLLHNTDHLQH